MKIRFYVFLVSLLTISVGTLFALPSNGNGKSVENEKAIKTHEMAMKTLEMAVRAIDHGMEETGIGIPQSLINKSEGIVIFPKACQVIAGPFNGPGGRGIVMIHNEDGSWSSPFFVTLREGNQGFQIGSQTSDIVLLFKDRNDIIDIDKKEITLGNDVGVAAGPVIADSHSSTDIIFDTEIYSYHRDKGFFTGISLKGGILSYSKKLSESLCGINDINMNELIAALNMHGV